ncbi:hypothetical protein ACO1O0_000098 [Amphichorda felina]
MEPSMPCTDRRVPCARCYRALTTWAGEGAANKDGNAKTLPQCFDDCSASEECFRCRALNKVCDPVDPGQKENAKQLLTAILFNEERTISKLVGRAKKGFGRAAKMKHKRSRAAGGPTPHNTTPNLHTKVPSKERIKLRVEMDKSNSLRAIAEGVAAFVNPKLAKGKRIKLPKRPFAKRDCKDSDEDTASSLERVSSSDDSTGSSEEDRKPATSKQFSGAGMSGF